jgi:uncharacterized protein YjbJ (UPF0337 family)
MKSAKRSSAEGRLDQLAGRVMEVFGKVTGRRSTKAKAKAKGKATRGRGAGRRQAARAKRGR